MKKIALLAASLATLIAGNALAQPGGNRPNPDSNGDGIVTRAEVEADVGKRFARMDLTKDGKLDAADREAMKKARESKRKEGGGGMLARVDTNKDGAVSIDEMKRAALARFDRADVNKDGKLTAEEREAARPRDRGGKGGPAPSEG